MTASIQFIKAITGTVEYASSDGAYKTQLKAEIDMTLPPVGGQAEFTAVVMMGLW